MVMYTIVSTNIETKESIARENDSSSTQYTMYQSPCTMYHVPVTMYRVPMIIVPSATMQSITAH